MDTVVLASKSPRRREILKSLNIPFLVYTDDIDEEIKKEDNRRIVPSIINLSRKKVAAVSRFFTNGLIIGVDTVIYFNRKILGKPEDAQQAWKYLRMLSGNRHQVISGITVRSAGDGVSYSSCSITEVHFARISDSHLKWYIDQGEWVGKAGGYGIQGQAALFVERITGSYHNVVGLPVEELYKLLCRFSYFESEGVYRPIKGVRI
jgi:septum formation protein